jgi:hypothetical protein
VGEYSVAGAYWCPGVEPGVRNSDDEMLSMTVMWKMDEILSMDNSRGQKNNRRWR